MKKLLIICFVLGVSTSSIYAQNKTIKGRVIDEDLETPPVQAGSLCIWS
jgi:hypothetical protein